MGGVGMARDGSSALLLGRQEAFLVALQPGQQHPRSKNPDFPTGLQRWASGPPSLPPFLWSSVVSSGPFGLLQTRASHVGGAGDLLNGAATAALGHLVAPRLFFFSLLLFWSQLSTFIISAKASERDVYTLLPASLFKALFFFPACTWSWPRGHRPVCWSLQWAEPWGGGTPGSSFKCWVCAAGAPRPKVRGNGFLVFSGVVGTPAGRVWSRRPQDNLGIIHFPLPRLSPAPLLR